MCQAFASVTISYISFFEEDVDIKYMSIYKEENNKKDCFEHLISLQGMYFPQSGSYCVYYFLYILYIFFFIRGIRGS